MIHVMLGILSFDKMYLRNLREGVYYKEEQCFKQTCYLFQMIH